MARAACYQSRGVLTIEDWLARSVSHRSTSAARQAFSRGDIKMGAGNFPARSIRQIVEWLILSRSRNSRSRSRSRWFVVMHETIRLFVRMRSVAKKAQENRTFSEG
jgi:hypothetical protein